MLKKLEEENGWSTVYVVQDFEFRGYSSCNTTSDYNCLRQEMISHCIIAVETGRRYFPRCSEVLDKFMLDDLPDSFYLEKGTPEEQKLQKKRFIELKEDVQKAFTKDKAQLQRDGLSSSSSSPSLKRQRKFQS